MRMSKTIHCTFVLFFAIFLSAQAQEDALKSIKNSFKTGNAKELVSYLGTRTEIAFDGEKKVYDKSRAEQTLVNFLNNNKPKDFQILHQGASKEGLKFYIGELESSGGIYRVLVYLRSDNGKTFVETIDISKE